jgi:hypothetical protein
VARVHVTRRRLSIPGESRALAVHDEIHRLAFGDAVRVMMLDRSERGGILSRRGRDDFTLSDNAAPIPYAKVSAFLPHPTSENRNTP